MRRRADRRRMPRRQAAPSPSNLLGKDQPGPELVEAAEIARADEAREGGRLRQAELIHELADAAIVPCLLAGADERDRHPALIPDSRERFEQPLVVLVRPGLRRVEEEGLGKGEPRAQPVEVIGGGGRVLAEDGAAGHDGDLLRGKSVLLDEVPAPPGGHRHDQRGPVAVGPVDPLPPGALPGAEQLGQMEVLQVVGLVDAGNVGREGVLEREVHEVDAGALDRAVACAHREPDAHRRQALEQRASHSTQAPVGVAASRGEQPAGPTDVLPDPLVVLGVGEEEVLLVAVLEPGEGRGEPDHDLLDAAEPPGAETGVDADAQRGHAAGSLIRSAWPLGSASRFSGSGPQNSSITSRCS